MADDRVDRRIDEAFRALPLASLADAALSRARELGAAHADLRVERIVTQSLALRDGVVSSANDDLTLGLAVRVIVAGTWGFAATDELTPTAAAAARTGRCRWPAPSLRSTPSR